MPKKSTRIADPAEIRVEWIPLERVTRDPALQLRSFADGGLTDPETIERYKEYREDGGEWKDNPVIVSDGEHNWLVAGFHRVEVDEQLGKGSAQFEVITGTYRDALFLALSQNADHGLQRSPDCCKRAVETLLDAPDLLARVAESSKKAGGLERAIARTCGASKGTVHNVLRSRGLHISRGGRIEPIDQPAPRPSPTVGETSPDDPDEPDDTGHITAAKLAGPRADRQPADDADDTDEVDDSPAYTVPTETAAQRLADQVATLARSLEAYAESDEGAWLMGKNDQHKRAFVLDVTGPMGEAVTAGLSRVDAGYQTAQDRNLGAALAHSIGVTGEKAQTRFSRCGWLRELADVLNSYRPARAA